MKYKIIKKESKRLNVLWNGYNKSKNIEVEHNIWYEGRRKGILFGFWYKIGHEANWDGDLIAYTAKTIEEMEDYIRKWHEVRYFNKPIEIIKDIDI